MEASNSKLKLKLLIDKKSQKVLFAEANNEFVDFLFGLMSLPLSSIVKLLTKSIDNVGCIGDFYDSIQSLPQTSFQSTQNIQSINRNKAYMCPYRSSVLHPEYNRISPSKFDYPFEPSSSFSSSTASSTLYKFGSTVGFSSTSASTVSCKFGAKASFSSSTTKKNVDYHPYLADDPNTLCPICCRKMSNEMQFMTSAEKKVNFEKYTAVNFMVMDNLVVKPMSAISTIDLINSLKIRDMSLLEEMVVHVGQDEGLKLLKAALQSKSVLTSVFLVKNEEEYSVVSKLDSII